MTNHKSLDPLAPPAMSGAEMCHYISDFIVEQGGPRISPAAIWNQNSRGELFPVYNQFWEAWAIRNKLIMDVAGVTIPVPEGREKFDIVWRKAKDAEGARVELSSPGPPARPPRIGSPPH